MHRAIEFDQIRRPTAAPDDFAASVFAASVAVIETGSLVIASGSGRRLTASSGDAGRGLRRRRPAAVVRQSGV